MIAAQRARLEARLDIWISGHSAEECQNEMEQAGVVAAPVLDVEGILADSIYAERGNVVTVEAGSSAKSGCPA